MARARRLLDTAAMRALAAPLLVSLAVVVALGPALGDELDPVERTMLDPLREQALHPRELIARLQLAPTAVIADVGAGPGFLTLPLAAAVPRGRVIATDVRAEYLATLARRARAAGVANVETRVVPADRPALDAASIDLALLCQVDQYLPDRVAYLRELKRALKPHGRVVLVNYARFRDADLAAARAASLRVVDEWAPSPPFFVLTLSGESP
jgi:ubiquinone/menaquinone biosynthesis C-methylase UbiE